MLRRLMSTAVAGGPIVDGSEVRFAVPDPERRLRKVVLVQEVSRPRHGPAFTRSGESWICTFPRPDVDRFEYLLELTWRRGRAELAPDPTNPLRAPGPYGDKSVVELEGYRPPGWLEIEPDPGTLRRLSVRAGRLRATLEVSLWAVGAGGGQPHHPLLVAHDGPEYAELSKLLHFLGALHASGRIPAVTVALLPPVDRNETYSASALYSAALAREIVPALAKEVEPDRVLGMGASLGALAMLHAHRRHPRLFDGLFLQSGSYFRQRWDKQESRFPRFRRISRFVGEVLAGRGAAPVPVAITVGTAEENLANNRAVAAALAEQGYDVRFATIRDAHNWTCWRDSFDPQLTELLA
jgi:enterochelin esterase family protein